LRKMWRWPRSHRRGVHLHLRMHILCGLHKRNECGLSELRRWIGPPPETKGI